MREGEGAPHPGQSPPRLGAGELRAAASACHGRPLPLGQLVYLWGPAQRFNLHARWGRQPGALLKAKPGPVSNQTVQQRKQADRLHPLPSTTSPAHLARAQRRCAGQQQQAEAAGRHTDERRTGGIHAAGRQRQRSQQRCVEQLQLLADLRKVALCGLAGAEVGDASIALQSR